jgi:general secretion pathway protein G
MQRRRIQRQAIKSGFTLMEVLLVLIIIVVIAGFGIRALSGTFQQAKQKEAKGMLGILSTSLKEYQLMIGSLPQELEALHTQPADADPAMWVKKLDKIPVDPWNRAYEYKPNGVEFDIRSVGPDGQSGTQDDITL